MEPIVWKPGDGEAITALGNTLILKAGAPDPAVMSELMSHYDVVPAS